MKKFLVLFLLATVYAGELLAASLGGAGASNGWGDTDVRRKISIQQGTAISAWDDRGSVVTFSTMTACGDGTYFIEISTNYGMVPGAIYNFMFFAQTPSTWAPTGLSSNKTYAEPVPSSGSDAAFIVCTDSSNISGTRKSGAAYYSGVGPTGGDGRRVLAIPTGVTKLYVYSNFGSTPTTDVSAMPAGSTSVDLSWTPIGGSWGSDFENVDVTMGGNYNVYRSSALDTDYVLILSTAGACKTYTDTGAVNGPLVAGDTYYYVVVSSDPYSGLTNTPNTVDANLVKYTYNTVISTTPGGTNVPYMASARPANPIPVYFKVEKPNWDYIEQNGYIVYLTPAGEDGRFYPYKVQGKITRVCLPRT